MNGSIKPGDGLIVDQDGLIEFDSATVNTQVKNIDTSTYTNVPNVFIKKSNTIVDHGTYKEYDNEMTKLTADCMNN